MWTNAITLFGDISKSDLHNGILVTFVGEEAVDSGGPSRELFSLLWTEMSNCPLTEGTDHHLVFKHDVCRLAKKEFEVFGTLMALCLIIGAKGPMCLSSSVLNNALNVTGSHKIADVPDFVVKQKLTSLSNAANTVSLNDALEA